MKWDESRAFYDPGESFHNEYHWRWAERQYITQRPWTQLSTQLNMKYSSIILLFAIAANAMPTAEMPYEPEAGSQVEGNEQSLETPCPESEVESTDNSLEETTPIYPEEEIEPPAYEAESEVEAEEEEAPTETPCAESEVEGAEETLVEEQPLETPCPESEVESTDNSLEETTPIYPEEEIEPPAYEAESEVEAEEEEAPTETPCAESEVEAAEETPCPEDSYPEVDAEEEELNYQAEDDVAAAEEEAAPVEDDYYNAGNAGDEAAFSQSSAASLGVSSLIALVGILALL
jgi:hypothetical protein